MTPQIWMCYNFNNEKAQAVRRKGEKRYGILVPKYKKENTLYGKSKKEAAMVSHVF